MAEEELLRDSSKKEALKAIEKAQDRLWLEDIEQSDIEKAEKHLKLAMKHLEQV